MGGVCRLGVASLRRMLEVEGRCEAYVEVEWRWEAYVGESSAMQGVC